MQEVGLARRYARALFFAVREEKGVSVLRIQKELKEICQVIYSSRELEKALTNPLLSFEKRKKILHLLMEKSPIPFFPLFTIFMDLLLKKNRLYLLPLIDMDFDIEIEKSQNVLKAAVRSASMLDGKTKQEMERRLSALFNRKVLIEDEVQPDLLAGVVIQAGDTVIDNSLKSQLLALKERFTYGH